MKKLALFLLITILCVSCAETSYTAYNSTIQAITYIEDGGSVIQRVTLNDGHIVDMQNHYFSVLDIGANYTYYVTSDSEKKTQSKVISKIILAYVEGKDNNYIMNVTVVYDDEHMENKNISVTNEKAKDLQDRINHNKLYLPISEYNEICAEAIKNKKY